MRTNLRNRPGARIPAPPVVPSPEVDPVEPIAPETARRRSPRGGAWAEDWSDPSKMRQMSPIWPLLWLTVPFVLAIVYELFKGH